MSILTTWGYTLTDVDAVPAMITPTQFHEFTANKYIGDTRVNSDIKAASSTIRNYCGWHVYPQAKCELSVTFLDKRVTVVDTMILIQLPATFVPEVFSVTINGVEQGKIVLEPNGIVRVCEVTWPGIQPWTPIVVTYRAGYPEGSVDDLLNLITQRVCHALDSSGGVQSETAGGVSVTYNAAWANSAKATALADDNKEVLSTYRLRGVF